MSKTKLGIVFKWNLAMLPVFVVVSLLSGLYMQRAVVSRYTHERESFYARAAADADKRLRALDELSISEAGLFLNDLAQIAQIHVIVSDLKGSKIYDSLEPMNLYPPGRVRVIMKPGKSEPRINIHTTVHNESRYEKIGALALHIGSLDNFDIEYTAPVHGDNNRIVGQIIFTSPLAGLDETIEKMRRNLFLIFTALYIAITCLNFVLASRFVSRPLAALAEVCEHISEGRYTERAPGNSGDEIGDLAHSFNSLAYNIEKNIRELDDKNAELIKYSSELENRNQELNRRQRMIEFDLRLAHKIQQELLPQVYPKIDGLQISAANFQVGEIGGDCFDFYKLGDRYLGAFIGDVSGKGISAALVMSMVTILFGQLKDQFKSPGAIQGKVNDIMYRHFGSQHSIYLTCFFLTVDLDSMELIFSCAGHNPPFLFRPRTGEVIMLDAEGFGLGMFSSVTFEEKRMPVLPGDKIILYTDGVVDSRNDKGSMFGQDRLIQKVKENPSANSYRLTHFLVEEIEEFAGETPRQDDLTILIIEIEENGIRVDSSGGAET